MADSIRMMDVGALTRALEEFRRLDPEQRVLAHRLATQAAVKRVEENHKDVDGPERSAESRIRPKDSEGESRRDPRPGASPSAAAASGETEPEGEAVPERDEGRLLDIRV